MEAEDSWSRLITCQAFFGRGGGVGRTFSHQSMLLYVCPVGLLRAPRSPWEFFIFDRAVQRLLFAACHLFPWRCSTVMLILVILFWGCIGDNAKWRYKGIRMFLRKISRAENFDSSEQPWRTVPSVALGEKLEGPSIPDWSRHRAVANTQSSDSAGTFGVCSLTWEPANLRSEAPCLWLALPRWKPSQTTTWETTDPTWELCQDSSSRGGGLAVSHLAS